MILNSTNCKVLHKATKSKDTDHWKNIKVEIGVVPNKGRIGNEFGLSILRVLSSDDKPLNTKSELVNGDENWDRVVAYVKENKSIGLASIINNLQSKYIISTNVKKNYLNMLTNDKIIKELENDYSYYGSYGKQFLSNSDIDDLLNNPKNFKKGKDKTVPMLIGSYFHVSMLEPHKLPDFKIVDASTRNTNIYKDAGSMLLLRKEAEEIDELVSVMKGNLTMYENIYKEGNRYEVPAIKEIYGTMWKGKADIITDEYVIDIKTTSKIDDFKWSARKYNYDSQAWIYQKLFEKPLIFT